MHVLIGEALQATTTVTATTGNWQPDVSSVVLWMGALASFLTIIYMALRIREHLSRQRVSFELLQAVPVDSDNLHVVFRVRKKGAGATSLTRVYHESGAWGRFFYRLFQDYSHQELVLKEVDASALYDIFMLRSKRELELMGNPVTLPLGIEEGDTRHFHTFLNRRDPDVKHHLVLLTTHRMYVKKLSSEFFREDSRAAILGVFHD